MALLFPATALEQAIKELKQVCRIPKEIHRLENTMNRVIAKLKDAEKQVSSEKVRLWLGELKQVMFDAEDLIDEFATDAAVQSRGTHTYKIPTITPSMMGQIREMNDRLDLLEPEIPTLGFQLSTEDSRLELSKRRQTGSLLPNATSVIGRDREREHIIEILLSPTQVAESSSNNKSFSIVPIVGLGGVGKTTLAQLVYNDWKIKEHFELMMWVYVSNDVDRERVTKDMIEAAVAFNGKYEQCQVKAWNLMQRRLLQEVKGKTFLLVLDDVWEAENSMWEELFKPLHSGKQGSKVLVTARNRAFVNKLEGPMETPIALGGLSDADIWDLFKKYAFRGNIDADGTASAKYSHLEDIGRRIVLRLKGSPLAARTIGSLLNHDLDVQHWKTAVESEFWKLEQGTYDILPALQLSYQYLRPDLKQCFAYCSLFPKDYMFSREEVVQLWEAQSFISKDRGTRMETVGSKYFDEFVYMSFFEPKTDNEDYYVMHDLIHDLAEYVSSDDCIRLEDQKRVKIPDTVRHMSVWVTERNQIDIINKLCCYEKLLTLLFSTRYPLGVHLNTNDLDQLFLKLKMLRVLGLYDCGIRELPVSIGDLKHLRYIDLENNNCLKRLPKSLGNLYNLQVLNLKDCHSLSGLPATMSQLVNLRHLRAENELISTIDGLGKLTGLQELEVRGRRVRELGGMCMLRQLIVNDLEEVGSKEEAIQARLQGMECLQVLKLYWSWNNSDIESEEENSDIGSEEENSDIEWKDKWSSSMNQDSRKLELEEEVLQALRPNDSIQELYIEGYGGTKSPDWMEVSALSSFSLLRRVSLCNCPNWQVPPCSFLGQLHHLEYLEIYKMPEWKEWSCPVSWDCLLELTIIHCPKLKELPLLPPTLRSLHLYSVGVSRLPGLHGCSRIVGGTETTSSAHSPSVSASLFTLSIFFCDNLKSISGLLQQHLPNLLEIRMTDCHNLVSLPESGFGHLVSLMRLHITNCPKLTCLLQGEEDVLSQHLPRSLQQLEINQCGNAMGGWWWVGLQRLTSIAQLSLHGCPTTSELLFDRLERHYHPYLPVTLRELLIDGCNRFDNEQQSTTSTFSFQLSPHTPPQIPHNVDASARALRAFTSLKQLTIRHSPNFLQRWGGCTLSSSLERLTIVGGDKLDQEFLSTCLHALLSLKELTLEHLENLRSLPNLSGLTSLESLHIKSCPSIHMLEAMSLPNSLKDLTLSECKNLHSLSLTLNNCLSSLETLDISDCSSLQSLPETLSHLSSLRTLTIWRCHSIQSWPTSILPSSLKTLQITGCPALTGRHKDKPKSMWPEVAHIPNVIIDGRRLQ